jgi:hypothetical protein
MVIAPANTGRDRSSNSAVITTDQTKSGIRSGIIFEGFILIVVEIKFTAPRIDDTPARWREKIVKSTEAPAWAIPLAKGG